MGQKVTTLQWDEVQVSDGHHNASVIDLTVIYEQCFSYFYLLHSILGMCSFYVIKFFSIIYNVCDFMYILKGNSILYHGAQ